jgi:hypothetical protein
MFGITEVQAEMKAKKDREDKKDREALTSAHTVAEAELAEMDRGDGPDAEAARKAIAGIDAEPGPGIFGEPSDAPAAGSYDRPYLDTGHASRLPQAGPSNTAPLPPQARGILEPLPQAAEAVVAGPGANGPIAATMKQHQARAMATSPVIPVPRGAA